jgi:Tol biopolymer transport system component
MDLDPDGYAANLDIGGGIAVPVNGSATFTQVVPGIQNVTLNGLAANCSLIGANPVQVTVASGSTAEVQFAINCAPVIPPGSAIAFTSLRDGNAEIYVLRAGASFTAVNLTNNAAPDSAPAWSPDGLAIAFATSRDFNDEVYKMNADGSAPLNLTLRAGSDQQPVWSPDGSKVVFLSTRNDHGDSVLLRLDPE